MPLALAKAPAISIRLQFPPLPPSSCHSQEQCYHRLSPNLPGRHRGSLAEPALWCKIHLQSSTKGKEIRPETQGHINRAVVSGEKDEQDGLGEQSGDYSPAKTQCCTRLVKFYPCKGRNRSRKLRMAIKPLGEPAYRFCTIGPRCCTHGGTRHGVPGVFVGEAKVALTGIPASFLRIIIYIYSLTNS